MMNPDVEIAGNNRNNDLKRQYSETNGIIFPTVYSLKKLIKNLKKKYHLLYILTKIFFCIFCMDISYINRIYFIVYYI